MKCHHMTFATSISAKKAIGPKARNSDVEKCSDCGKWRIRWEERR